MLWVLQQYNQRMQQHNNPIGAKIKRRINKNNQSNEQYSQYDQVHEYPLTQKENQHGNNGHAHHGALREISINISSTKQMPLRSFSKLINVESNSILNKSYSSGQLGNEKCMQHVRKINQNLQSKIQQTDRKIKEMSARKAKLQQKYTKLVNTQCTRMRSQIQKLNLNPATTTSNIIHRSDENQWDSLLMLEMSDGNQHPKILDSRVKLSQIRQKATELDVSVISKFAKNKGPNSKNGRSGAL